MRARLLGLAWSVLLLAACGGRPTGGHYDGGPLPSEGGPKPEVKRLDVGLEGPRPLDIWRPDDIWRPSDFPWIYDLPWTDFPPPVVTETVTCVFFGSSSTQECYSSLGQSCKGVGGCSVKVTGPAGMMVGWKSTCGSSTPTTVLDGKGESILFSCGSTTVKETVTCVFKGSSKVEECISSKGPSCKGVGSCSVTVSGTMGEQVDWKTSCGSYHITVLDGKNETITASCNPTPVSETLTCVFQGSSKPEICTSSDGQSCSGYGSCSVKVSGTLYQKLEWKASCGNSIYTQVLDGMPEKATFNCAPSYSETVTCLFAGSVTTQQCTSSKGSCSGIKSCSVLVTGTSGEKVDWKSTCGGAATTIIDGKSESITFKCPTVPASEWVTCLFKGSSTYQECYSSKGSCKGLLGCTVYVTGSMGEKVEWKSTCGGYAYTVIDNQAEAASFPCGTSPGDGLWWVDAGVPPVLDAGVPWPDFQP